MVIGAGCSIEAPTAIPLARTLAREAERQLVLNGRLTPGQCDDPNDLAGLATLVHQITGGQSELVQCFPLNKMRLARANNGYKILVALMAEGAIGHVLSLNFDLAVQHAAAELGVEIVTITSSGEPVPVRATLVQLHGNANSDPDAMVLRSDTIDEGWIGQWEQVVAQQILGAPTVLFVGLGSAAPVLSATIAMIQGALDGNKILYQADIGEFATNHFANELQIPEDRYIRGGWNDVLSKLAERVAADQIHALLIRGDTLLEENDADQVDRDRFATLAAKLTPLTLLAIGKLRAFSNLDSTALYRPHSAHDDELITEPIVRLAALAEQLGVDADPTPAGTWILHRENQPVAQLVLASGGGVRRMAALEPRARSVCDCITFASPTPVDFILVEGVAQGAPNLAHVDLIADENPADLIAGPAEPLIVSANDHDYIDQVRSLLNVA